MQQREREPKGSRLHMIGLHALATPSSRFAFLLTTLDGGLHIVTPSLELAQDTLGGHFAFQVFDCSFDSLVANGNFKGFALHCL